MNYLIILIVLVVFSIILAIIYDVNIKKFETYAKNEEKRLNSKIDKKDTDKVISVYKFYISLLIPLMFVSLFAWKFIRMAILFFMTKAF